MARALVFGALCAAIGLVLAVPSVMAAPTVDLNADQRSLIEQLTADKALAVARERRIAAGEQEALNRQLDVQDRKLRAAEARASGNAAELARVRKERDGIARKRQELVAALAERDRTLAAEVRAYREIVTGLATSPDPRKLKALQRFADGEQREALDDFDEITRANDAARDKAAAVAKAADRRPIASLALQARDEGKVTLEEVVRRHEEITRLDPMLWDWIKLTALYDEQGRLPDARKAAQAAQAGLGTGSSSERDRAAVLDLLGNIALKTGDLKEAKARYGESLGIVRTLAQVNPTSAQAQDDLSLSLGRLGEVAMEAGDLKEAKVRFEESLGIRKKLAQVNPTSTEAQRELSVSLDRLGSVALEADDLKEAKARFEESLGIRKKLAQANPTSTLAQRDLSVGLHRLGEVAVVSGDLKEAKARFEETLGIDRKLAQANPTSVVAQCDLSVSLEHLGDVAVDAGDLQEAKARLQESLSIRKTLAQTNPTSAKAQRDLSLSLERLGDVAVDAGDLRDAKARFQESLSIRKKLAQTNPTSAAAQRDLSLSLARVGRVNSDRGMLREALDIARQLERTGHLAPRDRSLLEWIPMILELLP